MNPFVKQGYQRAGVRAELDPKVDGSTAHLRLYDPIDSWGGYWGVSAKEFAEVLDGLDSNVTEVQLHMNSPGGEVFDAIAILNLLRAHDATVVAVVEGVAASSASFIACGCDELVMAPNSELFIHDAWGVCVGDAAEMQQMATELDHFSDNIASIYAAKAGGDPAEWRAAMAAESWYSAEQAVEAGLADRVDGPDAAAAADAAKNRFDLTKIFARRDPAQANGPSATPPSPSPGKGQKGGSMPELTAEQLALLGLTEDATDEAITAKLAELTAVPPENAPAPAAALPDGVVAIDKATLDQMQAQIAAGVSASETLRVQRRDSFLDAAVKAGKFPPARRDHWAALYDKDEAGTVDFVNQLAAGVIPVAEIGTNAGDGDTIDREFDVIVAAVTGQEVKS